MYRIDETEDGFVVVDDRTDVHESEVYANRECAQEFMTELAEGFTLMCAAMG